MSALTTRETLAKALHAVQCGCANPGLLACSGLKPFRDDADALIASGAVVDATALADDEAVYDAVENAVMGSLMRHGHADGCWPAVTEAAIRALAAALTERGQA